VSIRASPILLQEDSVGINVDKPLWRCSECHYWDKKDEVDGICQRIHAMSYATYSCPLFNMRHEEWDK
jgi:Zn-finger protein